MEKLEETENHMHATVLAVSSMQAQYCEVKLEYQVDLICISQNSGIYKVPLIRCSIIAFCIKFRATFAQIGCFQTVMKPSEGGGAGQVCLNLKDIAG